MAGSLEKSSSSIRIIASKPSPCKGLPPGTDKDNYHKLIRIFYSIIDT